MSELACKNKVFFFFFLVGEHKSIFSVTSPDQTVRSSETKYSSCNTDIKGLKYFCRSPVMCGCNVMMLFFF